MDRNTFATVCHDLAIVLRIAGFKDTAAALEEYEAQSAAGFFWNKAKAIAALFACFRVMQDELADRVAHAH